MKHYKLKYDARQAGMTLIELTVVLLILVALAGLAIPYVSGYLGRTEDSTSVSSLAEVDKFFLAYNARFRSEPNNMEALINGAAGTAAATDPTCAGVAIDTVYCKMINTGYFGTTTVDSDAASGTEARLRSDSLTRAGITSVYYNDPDTTDATFISTLTTPTPINDGAVRTLARIVPISGGIEAYLAEVFGTAADQFDGTCYDYVAFGIGNRSALTRTVMSTAPVHFSSDGSAGPADRYNRYVAIYQVDRTANARLGVAGTNRGCRAETEAEPAMFIGSVIAGNSLLGLARTQGQTYRNMADGR